MPPAHSQFARVFFLWPRHGQSASALPVMQELWDLTTQEARLAELLLQGMDSADLASRLGVSAHTVKYHLRGLLAKTGARRRADLVLLLASIRAPLG